MELLPNSIMILSWTCTEPKAVRVLLKQQGSTVVTLIIMENIFHPKEARERKGYWGFSFSCYSFVFLCWSLFKSHLFVSSHNLFWYFTYGITPYSSKSLLSHRPVTFPTHFTIIFTIYKGRTYIYTFQFYKTLRIIY